MLFRLLRQSVLSQLRSAFWERSLVVNILVALLALYLLLNFLVLGFFLDAILGESFPGQDIIEVANGFLLYTLIAGLIFRFVVQSFPVLHIQPYLVLPIRRTRLYHYLLLRSLFNIANLFPLVLAVPFAVKVVFHKLGTASGTAWVLAIVGFSLFNHYLAFYLKRQFNIRPLAILGALLLLGGLLTLDIKEVLPLSDGFAALMQAILDNPLLSVLPLLLAAVAYVIMYRALHYYSYLDTAEQRSERVESTEGISALRRLGKAGHFMQLELLQIWRNKRPKTMLIMSLFFVLYPFLMFIGDGDGDVHSSYTFMLMAIAISFPMINYGQFLIAWESQYFSLLMTRNATLYDYLKAKFYLFQTFNLITLCICLFYGLLDVHLIPVVIAGSLFVAGVTVYFVLFLATYNSKAVDPQKSAFMNWEGVSGSQFVLLLPAFLLPLLLYFPVAVLAGFQWAQLSMGGLGLLGLLMHQPLLRRIEQQLKARKHILIDSYKQ